jgi:glucokinase
MKALCGDIGGTNSRFAIFDRSVQSSSLKTNRLILERCYPSQQFSRFDQLLEHFLAEVGSPVIECCNLAIAGPIKNDRCATTNLPWTISSTDIARQLGIDSQAVQLLNDLQATAIAIPHLPARDFVNLRTPTPEHHHQTLAIMAPGTGLGTATLYGDGQKYRAYPGEGGHVDFAPRNEQEIELLRFTQKQFPGHVSIERLLSGSGIPLILQFVLETEKEFSAPDKALLAGDAAANISQLALSGNNPLYIKVMNLYIHLLGAAAGNLVLQSMATGGLILAGGIPPKIIPLIQSSDFLQHFEAKGRFRALLESTPVRICTNTNAPMIGALHY